MNIVIMRHGEAEYHAKTDASRALTARGCDQAIVAGQCLLSEVEATALSFDQLWVSPYLRTQQTAEHVLSQLGDLSTITQPLLVPDTPLQLVLDLLAGNTNNLLIVSHQPLVSSLVGALSSTERQAGPPMSPASMALVTAEHALAGCCEIQWVRHAPLFERSQF